MKLIFIFLVYQLVLDLSPCLPNKLSVARRSHQGIETLQKLNIMANIEPEIFNTNVADKDERQEARRNRVDARSQANMKDATSNKFQRNEEGVKRLKGEFCQR